MYNRSQFVKRINFQREYHYACAAFHPPFPAGYLAGIVDVRGEDARA